MSVMEQVQEALRTAIRQKDVPTRTVLRTLIGEAQNRALRERGEMNDAMIAKLLKDFLIANKDSLKLRDNVKLERENEVLARFIPQQMSEVELLSAIAASQASDIGAIMRHLKAEWAGRYDGKLAASIANTYLARV
jgi:uncharacterized protein YqeY